MMPACTVHVSMLQFGRVGFAHVFNVAAEIQIDAGHRIRITLPLFTQKTDCVDPVARERIDALVEKSNEGEL
jgi:hypothetical protein